LLGKNGQAARKFEGDGKTPIGRFKLLRLLRRSDCERAVPTSLPHDIIRKEDIWCDDPESCHYNLMSRRAFGRSHEKLWRTDQAYDFLIVLDYNIRPRMRGKGSAIFFHVIRSGAQHTEGCIAISGENMRRIIPLLGKRTRLLIGPQSVPRR
jgi:L,D-peptidoglycan transpeptidase YkuD (ErfK/YbiS/YcfS/YnhG family)